MTTPCRICGRSVRYVPSRFAYVHAAPLPAGVPDHAPIPAATLAGKVKS